MILVLPPDFDERRLDELIRDCERLAFRATISRGSEQIAVALSGEGNVLALHSKLEELRDVEVIPLLEKKQYRWLQARRRLLATLAAGFGALTVGGAALPVAGFLLPPKNKLPDRSTLHAGSADDVPAGAAKRVNLFGKPVWLIHSEGDRWFALSAICTHMQICQLEWHEERGQLVCPCHGGAFDVYGNVVQGPPSIPLRSYGVEQLQGEIYVRREV